MHCNRQYVGQTSYNMRHRFAGHRYAFTRTHKTLYYHFIKIHKTTFDVNITLVEAVPDREERVTREDGWSTTLGTLLPHGLNTIASKAK